ncbi:phage integrase family protein [Burkholderia gladioli]|uniref:phage integrase family protein n=1 Tax=Burkholderia gladioli TaxID=28095 RepID=UPI003D234509
MVRAGVMTFGHPLGLIHSHRLRWFTSVRRSGAVGVERIVAFVNQRADSLGYLSPLAMTPRCSPPRVHPQTSRRSRRCACRQSSTASWAGTECRCPRSRRN